MLELFCVSNFGILVSTAWNFGYLKMIGVVAFCWKFGAFDNAKFVMNTFKKMQHNINFL